MTLSAADIEKLCNEGCAASTTPDGGVEIGPNTEKCGLLANGIVFHELNYEALNAAIIGTSKMLLRPGLNSIMTQDHFGLWSWCAELLLNPWSQLFPQDQQEIKNLFITTVHAALANCRPPSTKEEWQKQNRVAEMQPHHARHLLRQAHLAMAYLVFPLLEAVVKRACANFVAFDGKVISHFSVAQKNGQPRNYNPGGRCSSLRDLLFLHYTVVADTDLKAAIDSLRNHINTLDSTQDPFDLIYDWRNQSLHGSANFQTIGGTVFNLCFLISLSELKKDFGNHRQVVLEYCRREAPSSSRSPWSFYPPY